MLVSRHSRKQIKKTRSVINTSILVCSGQADLPGTAKTFCGILRLPNARGEQSDISRSDKEREKREKRI